MSAALSLAEAVRSRLAFLAEDHGLEVVREDEHLVRLESRSLGVEVMFDPHGEVEVRVFRPGHEDPLECWTWRGMTGRASMPRLLELAAERMLEEEAILGGDPAFFERLAEKQRRRSDEWISYYAGTRPRPWTGKLPDAHR